MAIIRCTNRLLNELRIKPTGIQDQFPSLYDWHANLLWLNHQKYVLFTNDLTLYSLLMYWSKTPRPVDFLERFKLCMFNSLMSEGIAIAQVEYVLSEHVQVTITKSNSRSVLGSMNDLVFQIKSMIYMNGGLANTDISEISQQVNRIPMGAIKYKVGIDELKRRIADAHK
jgi:hypothetical protein